MESYEMNGDESHEIAAAAAPVSSDHGWHKVTYQKKQRKQKPGGAVGDSAGADGGAPNVFRNLEERSEDRRRRILEARLAEEAGDAVPAGSRLRSDGEDDSDEDSDDAAAGKEKAAEEEKKAKVKKPKKPKVTIAEAAAKIDESDLVAFLADITGSYEGQQEIQLMRFTDYFGKKFSGVNSAQFPWVKLFRESPVSKIADVPLSHISESIYKASIDWINHRSIESLSSFVVWCLDAILTDLAVQNPNSKGSKKGAQQASSKSQVAIFVALAMVLRRRPDALVNLLPTLRENSKYQGNDKVPLVAWMVVQAAQGDLAVGLYCWTHSLLPIIGGKSVNPQSRDTVLQVLERILSAPKARTILVNGAVRKGERLVPPSAFESLMRLTFPSSSARIKATERFEVVYPTLKEVALAGSSGSKAMKQVAQQIFSFAVKAAGEGKPELSKEAAGVAIWSLIESRDCYKQWDKVYADNLEASVAILKQLSENWKEYSSKMAPFDSLRETLKTYRQKNEKGMSEAAQQAALYRDADKYCKVILGKLSRGHGCLKGLAFLVVAVAVGTAVVSPNTDALNLENLYAMINSKLHTATSSFSS